MKISGTQAIQNLFLKEQNAPANQSPDNLHGAEQAIPQDNLDPSPGQTPQSYSTIRRSQPNNRPQLTLIKTDKTGRQEWSPLTKLALATAGVIKATALGYLAYTYTSTSPENPATHSTSNSNPSNQNNDLNDHVIQHLQNLESTPTSSTLPLILVAGTTTLVIGGLFGYLMSKLKLKSFSQEIQEQINNLAQKEKTLEQREKTLENEKETVEKQISDINNQKTSQEDLNEKNSKLEAKIGTLKTEKTKLETTLNKLNNERLKEENALASLEEQKQRIISETQKLVAEKNEMECLLTQLNLRNSTISGEHQQTIQDLNEQIGTLTIELDTKNFHIRLAEEKLKIINNRYEQRDKELLTKQKELQDLEKNKQTKELEFQESCNLKEKKIKQLETTIQEINRQLEEKERQKNSLTEKLSALEQKFSEDKIRIESELNETRKIIEDEAQKKRRDEAEKMLPISNRISELENSKCEKESQISDLENKLEQMNKELEEKRETESSLTKKIQEEQKNLLEIVNENTKIKLELANNSEANREQLGVFKQRIEAENTLLISKKSECDRLNNDLEQLNKKLAGVQQTQTILSDDIKQLNLDISRKTSELEKISVEINATKIELANSSKELEERKNQIKTLENEYDQLKSELEDTFSKKKLELLKQKQEIIDAIAQTKKESIEAIDQAKKIIETAKKHEAKSKSDADQADSLLKDRKAALALLENQLKEKSEELQQLKDQIGIKKSGDLKPQNLIHSSVISERKSVVNNLDTHPKINKEVPQLKEETISEKVKAPIAEITKKYKSLVNEIINAKEAFVGTKEKPSEQEYDESTKDQYKNKLSQLSKFLLDLDKSEIPEAQQLIFTGFIELLKYSSREATAFAIKCLDKEGAGCSDVATNAFKHLILKYHTVANGYEYQFNRREKDPNLQEQLSKTLSPFPVAILKQAFSFAKHCKKKGADYAKNHINKMDVVTLTGIVTTLFEKDLPSAMLFVDLFLDIVNTGNSILQDTKEKLDQIIGANLYKLGSQILLKYQEAFAGTRNSFNLKEVIRCISKQEKPSKSKVSRQASNTSTKLCYNKSFGPDLVEKYEEKMRSPTAIKPPPSFFQIKPKNSTVVNQNPNQHPSNSHSHVTPPSHKKEINLNNLDTSSLYESAILQEFALDESEIIREGDPADKKESPSWSLSSLLGLNNK